MVGQKLSGEAMAVVIGVVCGVAAGIPTAVLLLVALTRRDRQRIKHRTQQTAHRYAPVEVTIFEQTPVLPTGYWPQPATQPTTRHWYVAIDDDLMRGDRP